MQARQSTTLPMVYKDLVSREQIYLNYTLINDRMPDPSSITHPIRPCMGYLEMSDCMGVSLP